MQEVLITGATGLLGSSLVPYLRKRGYDLITHAQINQADFMFDLSDRLISYKFLEQIKPSVIINLVSLTNVELCEEQINLAYKINTCSVENIVHWIETTRSDCHLVQISTDHVYDGLGVNMENSVSLTNAYAFSKYAGELAAARIPSTILRTNFVGHASVRYRESLTDWVYRSIKCGEYIQVLSDVYFSPLSITKLIEMIEIVIQKKPKGIFNLGSRNGMSKADFVFAFADHLNLPTEAINRIETSQATFLKTYRPKNMLMDSSRFEGTVGVNLPNLNDLVKQIAEEYDEIT